MNTVSWTLTSPSIERDTLERSLEFTHFHSLSAHCAALTCNLDLELCFSLAHSTPATDKWNAWIPRHVWLSLCINTSTSQVLGTTMYYIKRHRYSSVKSLNHESCSFPLMLNSSHWCLPFVFELQKESAKLLPQGKEYSKSSCHGNRCIFYWHVGLSSCGVTMPPSDISDGLAHRREAETRAARSHLPASL